MEKTKPKPELSEEFKLRRKVVYKIGLNMDFKPLFKPLSDVEYTEFKKVDNDLDIIEKENSVFYSDYYRVMALNEELKMIEKNDDEYEELLKNVEDEYGVLLKKYGETWLNDFEILLKKYDALIVRYPLSKDEYEKMKSLKFWIKQYGYLDPANVTEEKTNNYIGTQKEYSKLNKRYQATNLICNYDIYNELTIKTRFDSSKPRGGNSNKSRRTRKSKKSKKSRKCKNYKK